jgi:hypothetical protein
MKKKEQQHEILGMPMSTAERKLRKSIIFELSRELGKNRCVFCGDLISDPDDLSMIHVEDWRNDPAKFFDLTNVAFSHTTCKASQGKRQGEEKMKVEVIVETTQGQRLNGAFHNGHLYVAGEPNQAYQIRLKNRTAGRVECILTVDGKNVLSGKLGSWDDSSIVLKPYQGVVIKGWQTSQTSAATFVFGAKETSYATLTGDGSNVGVIGLAVWEEAPAVKTVVTTPYRRGNSAYNPVYGCTVDPYLRTNYESSYSATVQEISDSGLPRSTKVKQELGTQYGTKIESVLTETTFKRLSLNPVEVKEIFYDSTKALREAGILKDPPQGPKAFPLVQGFCPPTSK